MTNLPWRDSSAMACIDLRSPPEVSEVFPGRALVCEGEALGRQVQNPPAPTPTPPKEQLGRTHGDNVVGGPGFQRWQREQAACSWRLWCVCDMARKHMREGLRRRGRRTPQARSVRHGRPLTPRCVRAAPSPAPTTRKPQPARVPACTPLPTGTLYCSVCGLGGGGAHPCGAVCPPLRLWRFAGQVGFGPLTCPPPPLGTVTARPRPGRRPWRSTPMTSPPFESGCRPRSRA